MIPIKCERLSDSPEERTDNPIFQPSPRRMFITAALKVVTFWIILYPILLGVFCLLDQPYIPRYLLALIVVPYAFAFIFIADRKNFRNLGIDLPEKFLFGMFVAILVQLALLLIFLLCGCLQINGVNANIISLNGVAGILCLFPLTSIFAVLCTGLAEELMLTYPAIAMTASSGKWAGIATWALLCFLLHFSNPNGGFLLIFLSISGAYLWMTVYGVTKSILATIGLHVTNNFILGGVFSYPLSGFIVTGIISTSVSGPDLLTGGLFGPEGGIVLPIIFIVTAFAIQRYHERTNMD